MVNIDIIIHVEGDYKNASKLITSIYKQQKVFIGKVIVALTSKNNSEESKFKEFCKKNNVFLFEIESWYYSSSLTIQRAIKHYAVNDIVIVLSQNLRLVRGDSLYSLVKDIASNNASYTFGRQIVKKKSGLEKLLFNELFRITPYNVSSDDFDQIKKETFFALTSYFALNRKTFLELEGYQNYEHLLEANAYYMKNLVDHNYHLRYSSESVVENPYHLTRTHVHDCYFYLGKFMATKENMAQYKDNNNKRLSTVLWKKLIKHLNFIGLFRLFFYMLVKKNAERKASKAY